MAPICLTNIYKHRQKADRTGRELNLLASYIKEDGKRANGWFFSNHFDENKIRREDALLFTRSILASQIESDSELSLKVTQAIFPSGPIPVIDDAWLQPIFPPMMDEKGRTVQLFSEEGRLSIVTALETPSSLVALLVNGSKQHSGWLARRFFTSPPKAKLPQKRLTMLESKLFRFQVLLLTGYHANHLETRNNLEYLKHGWGAKFASDHKSNRDMEAYFAPCLTHINIHVAAPKRKVKSYESAAVVRWKNPDPVTPAATRAIHLRGDRQQDSERGPQTNPLDNNTSTPMPASPNTTTPVNQMSRMRRALASASKLATSLRRVVKRSRQTSTPNYFNDEVDNDEQTSPLTKFPLGDPKNNSWSETGPDLTENNEDIWSPPVNDSPAAIDDDGGTASKPLPRILPFRDSQSQKAIYDESRHDDQVNSMVAGDQAIVFLKKQEQKGGSKQAERNASNVMSSVVNLAAIGSPQVQKIMKAVLTNSMANDHVTAALRDSGYAQKRRAKVIARKRRENEARRRHARRRGVEPKLVDETATLQFNRPLLRRTARAQSQRNWDILVQGKDLPPTPRPSNLSQIKVGCLVKWVVDNCQFRPGRMRNVRFVKEGTYLKDLPVYMRYGSFEELYQTYSESVASEARVGLHSFRKIMKVVTVKGSYNQGLSYYYVDYVNMTKLLLQMFLRMKEMIECTEIETTKKENIEKWLTKAEENTKRSREYLTHHYYADIGKHTKDSWTCAPFALGESAVELSSIEVANESRLFLALTNHLYIYLLVDLITDALPDDEYVFGDELVSMTALGTLSAKDTLHYTKHIMRGWWQDTAVNELKRMLFRFETVKGIIMDHKNKLLPRSKFEAMSAYFSKAGISILGAMIMWFAQARRNGKLIDGINVWFFDIVMNNTTAQEARDLMPCVEAIRSEVQETYFKEIAGPTAGLCFVSDNALVAPAHSTFIAALNNQAEMSTNGSASNEDASSNSSLDRSISSCGDSEENGSQVPGGYSQLPPRDNVSFSLSLSGDEGEENGSQVSVEAEVELYANMMRETFSDRLENWASVEPVIIKWMTFEAQRGKTQLDTHFAYLNKHLTKACLVGEIDYLNPMKVFEALSYKGGARATTTLLMDELEHAQNMFNVCDKAMNEKIGKARLREGISYVHDITFGREGATHRHFTNLDAGIKAISLPQEKQPVYSSKDPVGKVIDRHVNKEKPIFFAFKESLKKAKENTEEITEPNPKLLSTRVYNALMTYSAGMDAGEADDGAEDPTKRNEAWVAEAGAAREDILYILTEHKELVERSDDLEHPIRLEKYWAKAKQRDVEFRLSGEIKERLLEMFQAGQGVDNKKIRYTGEKAVMELQHGFLHDKWDQRLVVTIAKVKSFFSRMYASEQADNDAMRGANSEKAKEAKLQRARALLADCEKCEALILDKVAPDGMGAATLEHFCSVSVPLLKAFIKCRLLSDAGSTEWDKKMPNKGTLADNRDVNKLCPKTKGAFLPRMAFQLRNDPVKAKIVEAVDQNELEHSLFERGPENFNPIQDTDEIAGGLLGNLEVGVEFEEADGRLVGSDEEGSVVSNDDSAAADASSIDSDGYNADDG